MDETLIDALAAIPCGQLEYADWIGVGMALKAEGCTWQDWDAWSATDQKRYKPGECERRWATFDNARPNGVHGGSIVDLAKRYGWTRQPKEQKMFDWDDVGVTAEEPEYVQRPAQQQAAQVSPMDKYGLCKWESLPTPYELAPLPDDLKPADMLTAQLDAMFQAGERVNVVCEHEIVEDEHKGMGGEAHSVEDLHANAQNALDRSNKELGAYICVSPVNGSRKNENVTAWRNVLVECDKLPDKDKQLELIRSLGLPCRCIVDSGHKSIHAVVAIDAKDEAEYRERVRALYDYCKANGLPVDKMCKNPSRLMRLAGAERAEYESMQRLIATDHKGPKTWDEFVNKVQRLHAEQPRQQAKDAQPKTDSIKDLFVSTDMLTGENVRPVPPALIEGIMSVESVMMVAAPSKAGKSWCLIDLAWCLASGARWMGQFKCNMCRVLYINAEISEDWFSQRLDATRRAGEFQGASFTSLTTRGELSMNIDQLHERLTKECVDDFDVIIIDPVYMFEDGPENDQETIIRLMRKIGDIRFRCHCAVVFSHHFAKGNPALKDAMDRAAGSGVFQRFYDQGITLTPLQVLEGTQAHQWLTENYGDKAKCYEFSTTSRNYEDSSINSVIWSFPRFHADTMHMLDDCPLKGSKEAERKKGGNSTANKSAKLREQKNEATRQAIEACKAHGESHTKKNVYKRLQKVCERMGIDYPSLATFKTGWTAPGGQTCYRSDAKRDYQLFLVDVEAEDEDGNHTEPWLAQADEDTQ